MLKVPLVLKVDDWPEEDRALFKRLTVKGDLFDDPGPYFAWSNGTRRLRAQGYGQWLSYLARHHPQEMFNGPMDRIRRDTLAGFVAECDARLRPRSTLNLVTSILVIVLGADPDGDWSWLRSLHERLRARIHTETLPEPPDITASEVYELAKRRLFELDYDTTLSAMRRAIHFRSALMIAFLIARPVRRRALLAMKTGVHLRDLGDGFALHFPADVMKDKRNHDFPFPTDLVGPMRHYLSIYRPILLGDNCSESLWINQYGKPITPDGLSRELPKVTKRLLGTALRTHAFRHIAATSIAETDPEHVGISKDILGHATTKMAEKHYNRAAGISACKALQQVVQQFRLSVGS